MNIYIIKELYYDAECNPHCRLLNKSAYPTNEAAQKAMDEYLAKFREEWEYEEEPKLYIDELTIIESL